MSQPSSTLARAPRIIVLALLLGASVHAQGKTDVVTLSNGDHITGEIKRLERGRLVFDTDDAGTLYLEWDNLVSVTTKRQVEVMTSDGRLFLGSLAAEAARSISVVGSESTTSLPMPDVTLITPIGRSFWSKLDGTVDAGFSYTRSSGVAQLNFNSSTVYRRPAFEGRLDASLTQTRKDDDTGRDDRGSLEIAYLRYSWKRWFFTSAGRFETNESLGLELRSQIGVAFGPRLVNSNRAQLALGAGIVINDERGVDVEATRNLEALFLFRTSYYTYDRPKTNLDIGLQYYPSLSNTGRHRFQLDAAVKRELWKDLFVSVNGFNTYDNRPPNPAAANNDVGIVWSIGWSY